MVSLVLTIIFYTILELSIYKARGVLIETKNNITTEINEEIKPNEFKETKEASTYENIWQIEIPKINLIAPINEGTSQEVMQEYVGHFEDTEFIYGNVGLAAHNRGFPINYFARIK